MPVEPYLKGPLCPYVIKACCNSSPPLAAVCLSHYFWLGEQPRTATLPCLHNLGKEGSQQLSGLAGFSPPGIGMMAVNLDFSMPFARKHPSSWLLMKVRIRGPSKYPYLKPIPNRDMPPPTPPSSSPHSPPLHPPPPILPPTTHPPVFSDPGYFPSTCGNLT